MTQQPRLGLALSGGGFRAAAFHLGVLKRLEELRLLRRIEALSTVSGGSITGAVYALRCGERTGKPGSYAVDALISEMRPFLTENLRARALLGTPRRALRAAVSFVSTRVSRIELMIEELDRELFAGATLDQLPPWIAINATNLRTGKGWRFHNDRAGDYLAGATDQTNVIRVAEAVAASAAYPGLTDSYAFNTHWEKLRGDLLSEGRWERPSNKRPGDISRWRERYGSAIGPVCFPLVDGGLYDNEGINTLRGNKVTHAIISSAAPPESDFVGGFGPARLLRIIGVAHARLGGATRQLAHEITHGVDPTDAAKRLSALGDMLRGLASHSDLPDGVREALHEGSIEALALAAVGTPPRGKQFIASAQILLHHSDLADNAFASAERGRYDVPARYRGLDSALVSELSRVRTDLDALEPLVVDLLIAQGYFLSDFLVKLTMPELVFVSDREWYAADVAPEWEWAHATVSAANANSETTKGQLKSAAKRDGFVGRVQPTQSKWRYRVNLWLVAVPVVAIVLVAVACLLVGLWRVAGGLRSHAS